MDVKLKVCGMRLPDNIQAVASLQPDYLGFIFYRGSKRFVDGLTPSFVKNLPAGIRRTGVFVNEELDRVAQLSVLYGLNAVQLHGQEPVKYCIALKGLLADAGTVLIKAFGVDEQFDLDILNAYANVADYFLFDTQTPDHGGSGKVFNWSLLEKYKLNKPYFLSGGIGLDSIEQLKQINDSRLYAVDINSRFELAPGLKDIDKLNDFKHKLTI
ncbi:MAG: phosphoribosylanthranilate isomerase [Candidatus Pedobacter colombiensis]|uniref:N-(5'-phosphoribosyl)anthranilate isomerase n=1 Tax=Candidatus Pedobacter colombiensis TaxID=3121371 RepID=A0AAJ5W4Q3_9SPHI|nr:phosphoribosylanthranilate isomerase [Pedobacter sp.]WEK18096.1 MAG: phosphoribosylanthranilate isomerase [Pedobacter sp.]